MQSFKEAKGCWSTLVVACIQPLIKTIITKREPHLLESSKSFRISIPRIRAFLKAELNWSYRASTAIVGKLPTDYKSQGFTMAQRCAYLINVHNIPQELVVNTDQTEIHLVPTRGAKTWETKGYKHVNVHGIEDKRQIIVAVSFSATGHVLSFQVILQRLTPRSLPPLNNGRCECIDNGWHLTFNSNHWSTIETSKDFVTNALSSYRSFQVNQMGLPKDLDMIWLIDYWSVHISKEFGEWMKATHPQIHVLFIPANCMSIYQPADVILQ